jgi:hypothetical protein
LRYINVAQAGVQVIAAEEAVAAIVHDLEDAGAEDVPVPLRLGFEDAVDVLLVLDH